MNTTQTITTILSGAERTCCSYKKGDRVLTEYGPGTVHSHWGIKPSGHGYDIHSLHITLDRGPLDKFQTSSTYAFDLLSQTVTPL